MNIARYAEAHAPATIANLGPGFDILGLALAEPYDTIRAEPRDEPGVHIEAIHGDGGKLTLDAERNTAGVAAQMTLKKLGLANQGVRLWIEKGLPLASGLGSSAASAAAGAAVVNALFQGGLSTEALIAPAVEGEAVASGGHHADNVAPALLGGVVLVTGFLPDQIFRLPVPEGLYLALVTPPVGVPTHEARKALPRDIPRQAMVQQTAGAALLVEALHRGDIALLGRAAEMDCVIEPARQHLMPGLAEVRTMAKQRGATGVIISGAGPTLCAFCGSQVVAEHVSAGMADIYAAQEMPARTFVTQISQAGVRVEATF
jgi:homoserine kinase